jgi:hypothetical protein
VSIIDKPVNPAPANVPEAREITTEPRLSDRIFRGVVTSGGFISLVVLGLISLFLLYNGLDVFGSEGLSFITSFDWVPESIENGTEASYGIGAMLYGTLVISFIGLFFGFPLAFGTALFLSYYAPEWIKKPMVLVPCMVRRKLSMSLTSSLRSTKNPWRSTPTLMLPCSKKLSGNNQLGPFLSERTP